MTVRSWGERAGGRAQAAEGLVSRPRADETGGGIESRVITKENGAMASPSNLLGYCGQCLNNVQHRRAVHRAVARWLDRATGGVARYLGIGPWYCISCGHRALLFPPYRAGMRGLRSSFGRRASGGSPPLVERVGNVFDGPESLIGRLPATSEYSEKFRPRLWSACSSAAHRSAPFAASWI